LKESNDCETLIAVDVWFKSIAVVWVVAQCSG